MIESQKHETLVKNVLLSNLGEWNTIKFGFILKKYGKLNNFNYLGQ